jgi:hypothetical protein
MKSQILKKEEEVEKLEKEVVTLRSKIIKLKKKRSRDRNIHISYRE